MIAKSLESVKGTEFRFKWPDKSEISQGAFEIVNKLHRAGFETYIAGGAVRDALLKRPITEIDIATSAKPAQVKKLFAKTIPTGEKHGTVTVMDPLLISPYSRANRGRKGSRVSPPPERKGEMKRGYEVTTFRLEGPYKDRRHPSKVKFINSAQEDAGRRDFTINALFYDEEKNCVIDYVNGIADISHRKVRFIGKSEDRIKEDALRLLRAARFSTTLNFGLARDTQRAVAKYARLIKNISAERIKQELDRIMLSDRAAIGIGLLNVVGLLEHILPELKACQGVAQPKNQHAEGDVYAHSLLALEQADETYDLPDRYGVLFHDLGKTQTRKIRDGKITFYDHPVVGAELAYKICRRLKSSRQETERIVWLVRNHMVPNDFVNMKLSTRRKWGLHPFFPSLLKIFLADAKASLSPKGTAKSDLSSYREGKKILREIEKQPELARPLISGSDVMKILRIEEGPRVGKILKIIEEKKLASQLKTKPDAIKFLEKNKTKLKNFSEQT